MKKELFQNTLIIGAGRMLAQFSALFLIPLYTMYLSPDEYGRGDLIITYAALLLPLVTLALEQGAFRLLVDARQDTQQKTYVISFLVKAALSVFGLVVCVTLGAGYFYGFDLSLTALALLYAGGSIGVHVCLWLARGLGDNKGYAIGSVLIGVLSLLLSCIALLWLHMGLVGMIGSLAVANLAGVMYYCLRLELLRYTKLRAYDKKIAKELLVYSLPLVPNGLSWWLVGAADRTIIALSLGVTATGIFAVAQKFPAVLFSLSSIFFVSWHESASKHIKSEGRDEFFSKVTNATIVVFGSIGLFILAGLSVAFPLVIGAEFAEAYIYVPILMGGALFHVIAILYGSIYAAKMQTRHILATTLLGGVISVVGTLLFIPLLGLYAAAVASIVGYGVVVVCRHYGLKNHVAIRIKMKSILIFCLFAGVSVTLYCVNTFAGNIANLVFVGVVGTLLNKGVIVSTKDILASKITLQGYKK